MSTLYIVSTPIGNLGDMTSRALQVLKEVDLVAAEDTRRSLQLLKHFGIDTRVIACHEHNESQLSADLLSRMQRGERIALVSDAGTPLISDPGYPLVKAAREAGIPVVPVPGASSVMAALSVAGLPTDRFAFEGFVPSKGKARDEFYARVGAATQTVVCLEAPHRLGVSLQALARQVSDQRVVSVCRELTKTYEQVVTAPLAEIIRLVETGEIPARGEIVLVVAGDADRPAGNAESDRLLSELVHELSPSRAAALVARITGQPRRKLYERALELSENAG